MFDAIEQAKPGFTVLPARGESVWWFASTVLLTALGFYMWPHTFGSIYTAKGARVIRLNAIFLPVYQLILLFVFFAGFAAILQVPGLTGHGDRPCFVEAVGQNLRSLGRWRDRRGGCADRARSRFDDFDDDGNAGRQQSLPGV